MSSSPQLPSHPPLNRKTSGRPKRYPLRILQFGGGNFLRAFVDWMVDILNEKTSFGGGVVIVKPTAAGNYQKLIAQDGLFTVLLEGIKNGEPLSETRMISCVQEIVEPANDWRGFLSLAENETLRIVISNTTESGIAFIPEKLPENQSPVHFPAKLTSWLYHRFLYFKGDPEKGCVHLPCELIENNGAALRDAILQYAALWELETAFLKWIRTANYFCSTLVDRIVSGYPDKKAVDIERELGYKDLLLVAGEYYHLWVIQGDDRILALLPFHKTGLNVTYADDLGPSRKLKVRILNGAHTLMVPLGMIVGVDTVGEAMEHPFIGPFVREALYTEIMPALGIDKKTAGNYATDVIERFRNPYLQHHLGDIALNCVKKFHVRLLPSIIDYYTLHHASPKHLVFCLACLLRLYKGTWGDRVIPLRDHPDILEEMAGLWKDGEAESVVRHVFQNSDHWQMPALKTPWLEDETMKALECLEQYGIRDGFVKFSTGRDE